MEKTFPILEARVDWITATARTGERATELLDVGASILYAERARGNFGRPSNFEGYHGTLTSHAFVGYRLDGAIVRLGGEVARDLWRDVHRPSQNVSRLDVAVTIVDPGDGINPALAGWLELRDAGNKVGPPTEATFIQTLKRGDTLYIGKRASERFGRIYDKFAESKGEYPKGAWRYEIEYKGAVAAHVAVELSTARHLEGGITSMVHRRLQEWGLGVAFEAAPSNLTDKTHRKATDNETRIRWLRDQVARSVEKLSTSYTGDELRSALGLQHTVPIGTVREALAEQERRP